MKKIIYLFIFLIILVGCTLSNNPTSQVEDLLTKYQTLDNDIENGITKILNEENLNKEQKEKYKKIIEKQYKNLSYEIKDERIDKNDAIITVELEVLDYKKIVNEISNDYLNKDDYTLKEYNDDKINKLEKANERVIYTIDFKVKKDKDDNWKLVSLDNETIKKIQGMY